jgi:hypothetical protein
MKFIYLLATLLPFQGSPLGNQKLCVNCIFFKKDFLSGNKNGKCTYFLKENLNNNYLVDGSTKVDPPSFYYCSTARKLKHMCGEDGLLFVQKKKTFWL